MSPRAGLNPDRLAAEAADLADEQGLGAVTLTALARRVGVKPPSLYAHVASNRDLRQRLTLRALEESAGRVAEAVAGRSGREAIDALGQAYRDYASAHPGRHAAMSLPLDDEVAAVGAGPRHAELARAALRGYALGEPDETHAVRLLGATVRGWTDLERAGGFARSEPDAEASWQRAVDGLDVVFGSWSRGVAGAADPAASHATSRAESQASGQGMV
ncbi:TetR-like C-terminal domain-containing protein [Nocardioides acrostichi]|uniref:WHG domain-containing protein n=1 Tax=Nocardioides acrostichi TaxID=2784339 RepID=A0A930YC57_9ACTN|nr:TetR-like C-terminal domain-containing protein [Nocardioides acrostichi]MBF4163148.1 WHG domain-containing protein [Nocardioides acrostichi]